MSEGGFWDRFFSSFEELVRTPPDSVKQGVFDELDRSARYRKWMRRGSLLLLPFLLGGSSLFLFWGPGSTDGSDTPKEVASRDLSSDKSRASSLPFMELGLPWSVPEGGQSPAEPLLASASSPDPKKEGAESGSDLASNEGSSQDASHIENSSNPELDASEAQSRGSDENADPQNAVESNGALAPNEKGSEKTKGLERLSRKMPDGGSLDAELRSSGDWELDREAIETFPRFFAGVSGLVNFTRLVDQRTLESFEATSLVSTDADRSLDMGVELGVQVTRRSAFMLRYFAKEQIGQSYYQYVEGRYNKQRIRLSYRKIDLLFEHDLAKGSFQNDHRAFLSFHGGGHWAILRMADRFINGEQVSVPEEHSPYEFGVDGGLRFGVESSYGLEAGVLLNASVGLSDIRQKGQVPSHLSGSARKVSLGAGLSLRYRFGQEVRVN